jgi:pantothenate kinase type III
MLIAIDIGNSSINIGYFAETDFLVQEIGTHPLLSPSKYLELLNKFIREKNIDKIPEGIIISSFMLQANTAFNP